VKEKKGKKTHRHDKNLSITGSLQRGRQRDQT